jgi:hypothetical protein
VGAALTRNLGWQSIFWVNVPLGVVMLLAARFAAPAAAAPSAARQVRLDVAGLLTSALGLSALVFGLTQASTWGWTSPALWAILGVAAAIAESLTVGGVVRTGTRVSGPEHPTASSLP